MRNKDLENAWAVQWIRQEKCAKLEEENKKLKDDLRIAQWLVEKYEEIELKMGEKNKKLKKYYDRDKEELMESCYSLAKENDELKEENRKLKEDVDYRHHRCMVAERWWEDED